MIECEQFLYGNFNGVGYRLIKSAGVDKWLDEKDIQYLLRLDGSKEAPTQTLLHNDVVAITYFDSTVDEYNRSSVWNHTILLWIWDYFELHPPTRFKPHFMTPMKVPPEKLKPLKLEAIS